MFDLLLLLPLSEITPHLGNPEVHFHNDLYPTLGALLVSLITAGFSWWKARPKNRNDRFEVFMDESEEFREEMRKERDFLNKELLSSRIEINSLNERISKNNIQLLDCSEKASRCSHELEITRKELEDFKSRIAKMTQRITLPTLESNAGPKK